MGPTVTRARRRLPRCLPAACWALCALLGACAPLGDSASLGRPNRGALLGGSALPGAGPGFVQARPGDSTRYGSATLLGALQRALAAVQERHPGSPPMRVGDLSAPRGGQHPRHGSHRNGRDADLIFFATDAAGRPVQGRGWLAYDRHGVALDRGPGADAGSAGIALFDTPRNWSFVRALLADEGALVQWIFCSRGVKARLLRYAADHDPDPALLARAATVLHQPSRGRPHNDHFHVRVLCTAQERQSGCEDYGPIWPWLRPAVDKPLLREPEAHSDENLVRWLMEPLPETEGAGDA